MFSEVADHVESFFAVSEGALVGLDVRMAHKMSLKLREAVEELQA